MLLPLARNEVIKGGLCLLHNYKLLDDIAILLESLRAIQSCLYYIQCWLLLFVTVMLVLGL
jgi:hypothetical protein